MDRIKKISNEILEENKAKFGTDFVENKKILNEISIVRSKGLKNQLAGFITRFIKREIREKEEKLLKEKESQIEDNSDEKVPVITKSEEQNEETEAVSKNESENSSS